MITVNIPKEISLIIKEKLIQEITDFHVSGDLVYNIENEYIMKVSKEVSRLEEEYQKDIWFSTKLPTPKPIKFIVEDGEAYYLRECIDGENLCGQKYLTNPNLLIKLLKEALDIFHGIDSKDCPFVVGDGDILIHGDFCLPNILVKNDKVVGFVDLGDAGVGDVWCDYAWCIWSFEYNLKTKKYTKDLLEVLGIEFNQEKFENFTKY